MTSTDPSLFLLKSLNDPQRHKCSCHFEKNQERHWRHRVTGGRGWRLSECPEWPRPRHWPHHCPLWREWDHNRREWLRLLFSLTVSFSSGEGGSLCFHVSTAKDNRCSSEWSHILQILTGPIISHCFKYLLVYKNSLSQAAPLLNIGDSLQSHSQRSLASLPWHT